MSWKCNVLVVANVTATSDALVAALEQRVRRQPATITLIVPATPSEGGRAGAAQQLASALERFTAAGLEAAGSVGDADPLAAVADVWDPKRFDEIVISTLPLGVSKWLHAGLPERIGKLTGVPVTHLVSPPPAAEHETVAPPEREHYSMLLAPYAGLGAGHKRA
jgi:hypothetical protein